jgi:hypothetical protein
LPLSSILPLSVLLLMLLIVIHRTIGSGNVTGRVGAPLA